MEDNTKENLGGTVKKNLFWNFGENILYKVVQFLLQVVLARILVPEDYGLCAIVLAFLNIAQELVNSGFANALIQGKDVKRLDFSSVCYFSLGISFVLYIILFLSAPYISIFFEDTRITNIMRVLGISLIIGAFNSVQVAIVYKKFEFRQSFIANLVSISGSAVLGISAAWCGLGVWALVIQYFSNRVINTLVFLILVKWLPSLEFSFERIKVLFSYGWKLMITSLLSFLSQDIYSIVVGKAFSKPQLGLYDLGNKIPANFANTIASTIGRVLFPAFSVLQEDSSKIKAYIKKTNQLASFVMFPVLFSIGASAKPIIVLLFTNKWIDAVPIMQLACIWYAFNPIHYANIQVSKAIGRSDLSLYIEGSKKILDFIFLLIMVRFGIVYVALGLTISSILGLWIDIEPLKKYIHYSTLEQLIDVLPSLITGISIFVIVYQINVYVCLNPLSLLLLDTVISVLIFSILTMLFNRKQLKEIYQSFFIRFIGKK